jgi:hypothetical protein
VFEFPELVFAVFKGGKQKAPLEVGLASIKECGHVSEEPSQHMLDYL